MDAMGERAAVRALLGILREGLGDSATVLAAAQALIPRLQSCADPEAAEAAGLFAAVLPRYRGLPQVLGLAAACLALAPARGAPARALIRGAGPPALAALGRFPECAAVAGGCSALLRRLCARGGPFTEAGVAPGLAPAELVAGLAGALRAHPGAALVAAQVARCLADLAPSPLFREPLLREAPLLLGLLRLPAAAGPGEGGGDRTEESGGEGGRDGDRSEDRDERGGPGARDVLHAVAALSAAEAFSALVGPAAEGAPPPPPPGPLPALLAALGARPASPEEAPAVGALARACARCLALLAAHPAYRAPLGEAAPELRAALARSPGDPALARELAACLAAAGLAAAPFD